jgi:hypothetical protein
MTSTQGVEKASKLFTNKHELHLTTLQVAAVESIEKKYKRGVEENGGTKLWEMPTARLVENAIEEATDQLTYLLTLRQQMHIVIELARDGCTDETLTNPRARECCNLIYTTLTGQSKPPL